jgi:ABC-type transport system involved in multi-copper enzyme maturation permease subunit
MTVIDAATASGPTIPRLTDDETAHVRVTQTRVLGSEFLKLRTVRSTWFTLAVTIASMAGIGTIIAWSTANDWLNMRPRRRLRFDPLQDSLTGFQLAQLAIGVFGVLMIASEYSTGMIRSSLAGVPKRLPMLWAKVTVAITVALVTMVPSALFAFFASQRLLSVRGIQTSWSAPDVPRTVIGVALYLTVVAVIGVGLGAIMRNVAGAIATLVGVLLVLPVIALALPDTWAERINKYLPSNAGQALLGGQSDTTTLAPWTGFAVFVGYAVVTVAIAAVLLRRRDA